MKNEMIISKEDLIKNNKSYSFKDQDNFTINIIKEANFLSNENNFENDNQKNINEINNKSKSQSDSIKFESLESEKIESSEPKRSVNSIELILGSGKSQKTKNMIKKRDSFLNKFNYQTLVILTVFLNIFAGFYLALNIKKIKEIGIAVGIFLAVVILEWIGFVFAIHYSFNKKNE